MANKHGDYIWYELLADDADIAQNFYTDILGWQFSDSDLDDKDYRIFQAQDRESGMVYHVGGFLQLTSEMKNAGVQSMWLGYVGVDDVDASASRITGAGGRITMPATDIPNVGRIAMVTDPQGVPFYIMRGNSDEGSKAFADDKPRIGHCAWNELITTDPAAALTFYGDEFGWIKEGEMPMGDMGAYEFIRHGSVIGAFMRKPDGMPIPLWNYYFRVPDIDIAIKKIRDGDGQLIQGPDEIPGGDFIIKGIDPQGALFSLVGTRNN